jgi:hypothetical protein
LTSSSELGDGGPDVGAHGYAVQKGIDFAAKDRAALIRLAARAAPLAGPKRWPSTEALFPLLRAMDTTGGTKR